MDTEEQVIKLDRTSHQTLALETMHLFLPYLLIYLLVRFQWRSLYHLSSQFQKMIFCLVLPWLINETFRPPKPNALRHYILGKFFLYFFSFCLFFFLFSFSFLFCFLRQREGAGREGEKERERNINWLLFAHALIGDWNFNLGVCPDQELNPATFQFIDNTQLSHTSWGYTREILDTVIKWFITESYPGTSVLIPKNLKQSIP